jgi:hypothetical protein
MTNTNQVPKRPELTNSNRAEWVAYANSLEVALKKLRLDCRRGLADYIYTEGCSCCQNVSGHKAAAEQLALILNVPAYDDRSGYNFTKYRGLK